MKPVEIRAAGAILLAWSLGPARARTSWSRAVTRRWSGSCRRLGQSAAASPARGAASWWSVRNSSSLCRTAAIP